MNLVKSLLAGGIAAAVFLSAPVTASQDVDNPGAAKSPVAASTSEFLGTVYPEVLSIDVHNDPIGLEWQPGDPVREIPRQHWADPQVLAANARMPVNEPQADPLVERQQAFDAENAGGRGGSFTTPLQNYEGAPGTTFPPDPTGDIGTTQYVQAVNASGGTRVRVFDKVTGTMQANFILTTTLQGTNPCNSGLGDPIVLFDSIANRWVLTEFSPQAGRALCVYVSANADAANTASGNWFRYTFVMPSFPDYPKYGVWPDAYYVTANESGTAGSRPVYAFERTQMLSGQPARFVRLTVPNLAGFSFQLLTPAHFVGDTPPPANAPGIFMRHRDDEAHNAGSNNPAQDFLELWQLSMNWAPNPPVGTLTPVFQVPVAEFNSRMNGLTAFNAFAQPSGQRLDPLREPVMNVLMYRNFGSHESLVGNLVTNTLTDPQIRGAIRWFELRRSGSTANTAWQLHQEGTYAPADAGGNIDRWMAGSGIDSAGNIAMAYSVVRQNPGIFAGLRYIGRLASDPLGVMTTGEANIVDGERNQGADRWGDYHQMGVDPVDGCTFWFTGEYMGPAGTTNNTRIASFRHAACGEPSFTLATSLAQASICAASPPANAPPIQVTVGSVSGFTNPVALSFNPALPTGITGSLTPASVNPPGSSALALTANAGVAPGANTVTVQGTSGAITKTTDVVLNIATAAPSAPALVSPANNATNVILQPTLTWGAATQGVDYVVEVASDAAFNTIVFTGNVSNGTSIAVAAPLASNTTYWWRARAANVCGNGGNSTVFSFTTQPAPGDCAAGATPFNVF
ncbi:MAG: fibronectin type III domain-containing protein, partial [Xanthomonadales bacterium]|nr:fibronectin type III domain-containing protein [Xanthomonadales bacterium]